MKLVQLESQRLKLRPCADTDIEILHKHWIEPTVRRYLFDNRVITRQNVEEFVGSSCTSFQKGGYGLWLVFRNTDDAFVGVCGLWDGTLEFPELLFSIAPSYWGQGIATESAGCVLEYGFDVLKLKQVEATVDKPNAESIRVLEKLGMHLKEEKTIDGNPILCYAIAG